MLSKYRVWSDGTVQDEEDTPYEWMSDDYIVVEAGDDESASLMGNPPTDKRVERIPAALLSGVR